jgi:hypothetical protein
MHSAQMLCIHPRWHLEFLSKSGKTLVAMAAMARDDATKPVKGLKQAGLVYISTP